MDTRRAIESERPTRRSEGLGGQVNKRPARVSDRSVGASKFQLDSLSGQLVGVRGKQEVLGPS